ncbi:chromosomal replication initiator protein DnaA [Candidatus Babeliales bacterium]|nr:chromosomal replication initiator protein DnaA [Candidatus Babeliales bacterium]
MQLIWEEFLKIIKEEAGSQVVETWFKAVALEKWDQKEKTIYLKVPNQFVRKWLQEHYLTLIKTHISRLLNTNSVDVLFKCNITDSNQKKDIIPAYIVHKDNKSQKEENISNQEKSKVTLTKLPIQSQKNKTCNINEIYTFDSFVVGPNNSLAHAAAYAVCQNLGKVYNPLFIYGGTGLGKTHLLYAIGNELKTKNPFTKIGYITSDRFINEFINSIRFDKTHQFREKYQKIDILMVDDIQFLSNKEQTQESFFHIFNSLYEQQKHIILSSDTFPKEITGLQDRLRSRLEWGLVVDIQIPDLETKIAILKKKSIMHSIKLDDEVANFIASRITSNIRELEGALIRVGAFSTLTNQPVTLDMAKRVLLNLNEKKKEGIMLDKVLKIIAKHYSVSINDLKSKKRHKNISTVRQVAFYMMKKLTFCSLQTIGEFVGKRDHSTVLHAISKVEKILDLDKSFAQKLNVIEQKILMA